MERYIYADQQLYHDQIAPQATHIITPRFWMN